LKLDDNEYECLVSRWAPINYQYIHIGKKNSIFTTVNRLFKTKRREYYDTKQDLVVPVNLEYYQNDVSDPKIAYATDRMRDRLDGLSIDQLTPVVYYSLAVTEHHYYILYSFFHADDTTHPNDMEGCLVIIERKTQDILGMITVAHEKYPKYSYNENLLLKKLENSKLRKMFVENEDEEELRHPEQRIYLHPLIQQESGKHGLYGLGNPLQRTRIWRWFKNILGSKSDIMVLFPIKKGKKAKKYSTIDLEEFRGTTHFVSFYYDLVSIKPLWELSLNPNLQNKTFDNDGKFYGGHANPPWKWVHDGINLWDDPARLVDKWFVPKKGRKPFLDGYKKDIETNYELKMGD